jgi:hypothetical protein
MAIRLVATLTCDGCGAELVVGESSIRARNAAMVAKAEGWRIDADGMDLCPVCADVAEHPEKQLTMVML